MRLDLEGWGLKREEGGLHRAFAVSTIHACVVEYLTTSYAKHMTLMRPYSI